MSMRVLTSGIDSLYFSVRSPVRAEAWALLKRAKDRAEHERELAPVDFPLTGQAFLVKPHGWRGYTFWATSPDFELMVGKSEKFPPVYVQMHSAYLHSLGVEPALHLVELFLRHELLAAPVDLVVSRLDIHCDYQGGDPEIEDMRRFVCRGRGCRVHVEREEAFAHGRRLTGFMFGRGALSARLYDKTLQTAQRGLTWVPELWTGQDSERPVWRPEFAYERNVLREFNTRTVDEALAAVQDLWEYGTEKWLTLRRRVRDARERRWPLDPVWEALQAGRVSPERSGVVRRRVRQVREERVLRLVLGGLTSLAALRGWELLDEALVEVGPELEPYLRVRERTFRGEVRRKQARLLDVTGYLDEGDRDVDASRPWGTRRTERQRSVLGGRGVNGPA